MREPDLIEGQSYTSLTSKSQAARLRTGPGRNAPPSQRFSGRTDGTPIDAQRASTISGRGITLHFSGGVSFKADRPLPPQIAVRFESQTRQRIAGLKGFPSSRLWPWSRWRT